MPLNLLMFYLHAIIFVQRPSGGFSPARDTHRKGSGPGWAWPSPSKHLSDLGTKTNMEGTYENMYTVPKTNLEKSIFVCVLHRLFWVDTVSCCAHVIVQQYLLQ